MRNAAIALLALGAFSQARADTWAEPRTLEATSPSGAYSLLLVPGGGGHEPPSLRVSDRRGRTLWSRAPVNMFAALSDAVSDDGQVATVDDYLHAGDRHAVVLYDRKGSVVADHFLEKFLTPEEFERKVSQSVSSRWWRYGGDEPAFVGGQLLVTTGWGETVKFSVKDGKPARDPRRFGRLQDYLGGALAAEEQTISVKRSWKTPTWVERDLCTVSAAGCRCQRATEILNEPRGPVRNRPVTPAQWKALVAQAVVLVPLIDTGGELVTDPAKVQIELQFRRKNAGWDSYRVVLDPRVSQGEAARLSQELLKITGL